MSESPKPPLERAIEVLVYAPIGAGLVALEAAPSLVETAVAAGRAEVDRRTEELSRRVTSVRSMGQAAIAFGLPVLRNRARRKVADLRNRTGQWLTAAGVTPPPPPSPSPRARPATAARAEPPSRTATNGNGSAPAGAGPPSGDLAIPGYDALSASQVVERLTGLGPDELSAVRAYEAAHRNRRTILGKIDQLTV